MATAKTKRNIRTPRGFGEPALKQARDMERKKEAWDRTNSRSFTVDVPGRMAHALAALAKRQRRKIEDQIISMLRDSIENEHGMDLDEYGAPHDLDELNE